MNRWLAAAVALGCWGCAFTLDGPDPNRPRNRVPRCDTSKGLVALDGVMATALAVTALSLTSESEPGIALVPLGIGALYLAGAVSGNRSVNACIAAMDDYSKTYEGERMAIEDGEHGAPPLDDGPVKRGNANRSTGQGYPPQGYPQPGDPQSQTPYQQPRPVPPVQQPVPPVPAPQPPVQQLPQQARPTKQPKAAPPVHADDGDWTDFWREVP